MREIQRSAIDFSFCCQVAIKVVLAAYTRNALLFLRGTWSKHLYRSKADLPNLKTVQSASPKLERTQSQSLPRCKALAFYGMLGSGHSAGRPGNLQGTAVPFRAPYKQRNTNMSKDPAF